MSLKDKVCLITGGGSGIGEGTALMMAEKGAKVVLVGRTASKIERVRDRILGSGGVAISSALDVADHVAVFCMVDDVVEQFGGIDILVNNAGHSSAHRRLMTISPEEIRSVIDSNLIGTIYCTQASIPSMLKAKSGTIINVSSLAALYPSPFSGAAYGPAKAAVVNFTHFLNAEFRNTGIRSSVIIPGEVDTPIMELRPSPPSRESRDAMVGVDEISGAICLIAELPQRSNIPEMVIRPTFERDFNKEIEPKSN